MYGAQKHAWLSLVAHLLCARDVYARMCVRVCVCVYMCAERNSYTWIFIY